MAIGPSGDIAIIGGGGGGTPGVTDHALLTHLDYASAAHTGFTPSTRSLSTTAPLTGGGDLSADRTLGITQATAGTDGYLTAANWTTFNAKMNNPMTQLGDIIYGGALGAPTRLGIGAATTVLHGGATPSYSGVVEADLSLSAVTTANATALKHGFLPTLSNVAAQFLNGQGNWVTPSGVTTSYFSEGFTNQTSVNIVHNFGIYPVIQVIDNTGAVIVPQSIVNNTVNDVTVTFLVSTTGTIIATLGSPQAQAVKVVTINYPVTIADRVIKANVSGITITLLTAVGNSGREYIIDNGSADDITVAPQAGELIESESSQTIPPDSAMHVYSDGVGWRFN